MRPPTPASTSQDPERWPALLSNAPTLRFRLFSLVTAVALPLVLLAAAVIYDSYRGGRARAEERLEEQTRALALVIDREFGRVEAVLQTLAASDALARGDLDAFEREIRVASKSLHGEPMALIGGDGHQMLSTTWPHGVFHTERVAPIEMQGILQTGIPAVSNLHIGSNSGQPVLTVGVPVTDMPVTDMPVTDMPVTDAPATDMPATDMPVTDMPVTELSTKVRYVLVAAVPSATLASLLDTREGPRGWVGGLLDHSYHVAARTAEPERYLGTPVLPIVADALRDADAGVVRGRRVDGVWSSIVFARAPATGFVVAISVPDDEFDAPLRFDLWRTVGTGLVISGGGLALALWMARRLADSIQGLAQPGDVPSLATVASLPYSRRLREVDIVATRLARIAAERDNAEAALRDLADRLEHQVSERTEALAESEARLRAIFDAQFQYITLLDPDGRRLEMNRSALDFGAVEAATMLGTRIWDAPWWRTDPESVARIKAAVARGAAGRPTRIELQATGVNGKPSILDLSLRPVYDRTAGSVKMIIAEGHDITELRALEARVAQTSRLEALGQLAGGVAHDFNNIMQSISGAMSLINRRAQDPKAIRRLTEMVNEAIERGAAVTRRLLSFARRDALSAAPVDVADMLDNLREVLSHTLGSAIRVSVDASPNLPALLADRSQLETVLVNLATNARDAMAEGGVVHFSARAETIAGEDPPRGLAPPSLSPSLLAPGHYIRIATVDTGRGMDAATLARAVEPFFTTKGPGEGTGLGLAMARGFAEQSGGAMLIESAAGQGTTVTLWLPQATHPVQLERPATRAPADRRRLLLVEDSELLRELLAAALEAQGYIVTQAVDPADALDRLIDESVDLLITDLSMPGMSGLDLIRTVQKRQPDLPAILLTGYVGEAASMAVTEALRGHRFALVHKPVSEQQLADHVAALLEQRNPTEVG